MEHSPDNPPTAEEWGNVLPRHVLPQQHMCDMLGLLWAHPASAQAYIGTYQLAAHFKGTKRERAGFVNEQGWQFLLKPEQVSAHLQLRRIRLPSFLLFLQSKGHLLQNLRLDVGDDSFTAAVLSTHGSSKWTAPIQLTQLDLDLQRIGFGGSISGQLASLTGLEHLRISATGGADLHLVSISHLTKLTQLRAALVNPATLQTFPSSLRVLHITWYSRPPDAAVKLAHLQQLSELRSIGMSDYGFTENVALPSALTRLQCATLRSVLPLLSTLPLKELPLASIGRSTREIQSRCGGWLSHHASCLPRALRPEGVTTTTTAIKV